MPARKKGFVCGGFTLIELLVVIAVITLLLSIVLPLPARMREGARRVVCANNMRLFFTTINVYAGNNGEHLPPGGTGWEDHNYTVTIHQEIHDFLVEGVFKSLACPNLRKPFDSLSWYPDGINVGFESYLIGYNYLGGHIGTPWPMWGEANAEWVSPAKITETPRLPVITELNAWSAGYSTTFAPHGYRGPIHESGDSRNPSYHGISSMNIGSAGGNICLLDGFIGWKDIKQMKVYTASLGPVDLFAAWQGFCHLIWQII